METWNYKFLNLPHPPQEFIDLALTEDVSLYGPKSTINQYQGQTNTTRRNMKNPVSLGPHVYAPRYAMPDEFYQWAMEHIAPAVTKPSISISGELTSGAGTVTDGYLAPHTDRSRRYALLYVVKQGSDLVRTCFWQEKGQPQVRDENATLQDDIALPTDYLTLDLLESGDFGLNQWVILNSKVFHSVEHINGIRISFQIDFGDDLLSLEKFF